MFLIDKDKPPLLEETKTAFLKRSDISKLRPAQQREKWLRQERAIKDFFAALHGVTAAESVDDVALILAMKETNHEQ